MESGFGKTTGEAAPTFASLVDTSHLDDPQTTQGTIGLRFLATRRAPSERGEEQIIFVVRLCNCTCMIIVGMDMDTCRERLRFPGDSHVDMDTCRERLCFRGECHGDMDSLRRRLRTRGETTILMIGIW